MTVKTTLVIDGAIYKAAKRVAVEQETSISAMVRKGLLIYVSDPDGTDETIGLLTDKRAMQAIQAGEHARRRGRKDYYVDWDQIRDL